jgi:hypothetical protein
LKFAERLGAYANAKSAPEGCIENANRTAKLQLAPARRNWRCMGVMGCAVCGRGTGSSAAAIWDPAMGRGVPRLIRGVLASA